LSRGRQGGAAAGFGNEGGTGGIRQRSSDPTGFDNEQYMAELEANLLRAMNIPTDSATDQIESNKPSKVYQSNRSGSKTITGRGAQKSTSRTRKDENNSSKNTTAAGTKR